MKKKKSTILGVALTLMLLGSLLAFAAPVSAGTLSWTTVTIPTTSNEVLAPGTAVVDIAVYDADTIYAGGGAKILYKTTDRGVTWSTITTDNKTDLVAVAPDDSDVVAYVDKTDLEVRVSTDGGTNWNSLGIPQQTGYGAAAALYDIAISAESGGVHYIAVAGHETGTVGNVWYYKLAAGAAWKEIHQKDGAASGWTTEDGTRAVAFSPNFPSDLVMVSVGETDNTTVNFQIFSFNSRLCNAAPYAGFAEYPVAIVTDDGITDLLSASITLDPEYLGSDDAMRMSFVGLTVDGDTAAIATSGIYRLDDVSVKELKAGSSYKTHSIAFDGTNLVAGHYDTNNVRRSADPLVTSPTVSGTSSLKRPGGEELVVVAWAGDDVVAGTSGDESAFAVSRNDGKSFNDISLIDTTLTYLRDVVVSPDGAKVYLVSDEAEDLSLWRYTSSWERVLTVQGNYNFIVRIAPDDADVVYVADYGATAIYYSADAGETKWHTRTSRDNVQDLAVEGDGDVAYVAVKDAKTVRKSTNSGFTWGSAKSTKLGGGNCHMIASLGEDKLIVGSTTGYVSYSTDGNDSWTKISKQTAAGAVSVIASGLADDDYIYVGTQLIDKDIYRWQIAVSTGWTSIYEDTDTYKVYGIALLDGMLYVSTANSTDSKTFRTLGPTADPTVSWSTVTKTGVDFVIEPQGLKVTAASNKLWAIDTEGTEELFSYTDTLAVAAPTLVSPRTGFTNRINPVSGYAMDVTFSWEKPSDKITGYQLRIAFDRDFDEVLRSISVAGTSTTVSAVVGHSTTPAVDFMPGETYYWKVRVLPFTGTGVDPAGTLGTSYGPIYSGFSDVRSFTVAELPEAMPPVEIVIPPAPEITVEVQVPPPPPPVEIPPAPAPITPGFIWAIVIIGAILVIAVIVLIVRTRRPV